MSRSLVFLARVAPLALVLVSLVMSVVAGASEPCPSSSQGGC